MTCASQDMSPTIRRSQKVLVASQQEEEQQTAPGGFSSRLAYTDTALDPQVRRAAGFGEGDTLSAVFSASSFIACVYC